MCKCPRGEEEEEAGVPWSSETVLLMAGILCFYSMLLFCIKSLLASSLCSDRANSAPTVMLLHLVPHPSGSLTPARYVKSHTLVPSRWLGVFKCKHAIAL